MCGIFGLIDKKNDAAKIVFKGLSDIEYRGYDSWGISFLERNRLKVIKKIGFLPKKLDLPKSNLAIGHTRWATHGAVTDANAHPHQDCTNFLSLVHNGIVENFQELKKKLKSHKFRSETDSEIIVHLIEEEYKKTKDLAESTSKIYKLLEGLNAIVVTNGKIIVAVKNGSSLVVGKTISGYAVASDSNALLPLTKKLIFLEDNQLAVLSDQIGLYDALTLDKLGEKFTDVEWDYSQADLKHFKHFMLKEIYEQPKVLRVSLQNIDQIKILSQSIKKAFGTFFIGCGTASYACLAGVYLFSKVAKKHVNFSIGSEFNYIEGYLKKNSLLIAISQSGETIDIVEPVSNLKKKGVKIASITNSQGSTLYRLGHLKLLLGAGPEKAVVSTKAFLSMLAHVILLSFSLSNRSDEGIKIIEESAKEVELILKHKRRIMNIAEKLKAKKHIFCLGRGLSYPIALESALKIKETSYVHAEGFASGELKHGSLALIEKGTPVIVFSPDDETKQAVLANAMEVKARGGFVIGVSSKPSKAFDFYFKINDVGASSIIPNVVFAQLLAYFLSVKNNINPDKPRNLAKSVVVR